MCSCRHSRLVCLFSVILLSFGFLVCKMRLMIPNSRKPVHSRIHDYRQCLIMLILFLSPVLTGSSVLVCICLHGTLCFLHPELNIDLDCFSLFWLCLLWNHVASAYDDGSLIIALLLHYACKLDLPR